MGVARYLVISIAVGLASLGSAPAADPNPQFKELQGSWQMESLEQAGEKVDSKWYAGRVLFIGGRNAFVRQGSAIIQVAMLNLNATADKKYVNVMVLQGEDNGKVHLGIYQVKGDVLTICHDAGGIDRPSEFKTAAGTKQVVAVYRKRALRGADRSDVSGYYKYSSEDESGKSAEGEAIVERQGDSYSVVFKRGGGIAFVGIGIRDGDTFSVGWRNQLQSGISVYKIGADRKMTGKFTLLGGNGELHNESLTPEES